MSHYIWQLPDWPKFKWDEKVLLKELGTARLKQGHLTQKIQSLLESDMTHAQALILEEETLKTAQIEGEQYNPASVRSSIHKRLGLDYAGLPRTERHIDGLVAVLLDATHNFHIPLTRQKLLGWHASLFPTGYSGMTKIRVGQFRDDANGPMQVVSGPIGREKLHYQAPPVTDLEHQFEMFLRWWQTSQSKLDGIIRAGIIHLYFVTLHPFDDGNGRISRALADMALAQDDKLATRYCSLSREILCEKKGYYQVLEKVQKEMENEINDMEDESRKKMIVKDHYYADSLKKILNILGIENVEIIKPKDYHKDNYFDKFQISFFL